jgi:hypothetical protein
LRTVDAYRYPIVDSQPVEFGASLHDILDSQCHVRTRRILVRTLLGQWCGLRAADEVELPDFTNIDPEARDTGQCRPLRVGGKVKDPS